MLQVVEGRARFHSGDDVKLLDAYPLYEIGAALRHLKDIATQDSPPHAVDQLFALWGARKQLAPLVSGELIALHFCGDTAAELLKMIEEFEVKVDPSSETGAGSGESERPIPVWQMRRLNEKIEIFEHQFSAELQKTAAYLVPRRGIFDTEQLVDHAERHFTPDVLAALPEMAQSEFKLAGRCLGFGLFSACGYHAMRATESVLTAYYKRFHTTPGDKELTMGLMASQLDELAKSEKIDCRKPSKRTAAALRDVANFDRNPLMHPTAVLDEEDALMLFSRAQGLIIDMSKELRDMSGAQEVLPLHTGAAADLGLLAPPKREKKTRGTTITDAQSS